MNKKQKEILTILVENEINSDLDYLKDCAKVEYSFWKNHIKDLKEILERLKNG